MTNYNPFDKISVEDEFDDTGDDWVGHESPFMSESWGSGSDIQDFDRKDTPNAKNEDYDDPQEFQEIDDFEENLGSDL